METFKEIYIAFFLPPPLLPALQLVRGQATSEWEEEEEEGKEISDLFGLKTSLPPHSLMHADCGERKKEKERERDGPQLRLRQSSFLSLKKKERSSSSMCYYQTLILCESNIR